MSYEPTPEESKVVAFGHYISVRGILAIISMTTLSFLTIKFPEQFAKAYESISIAVMAFYFGQNSKK